jgi:hypothetical protein
MGVHTFSPSLHRVGAPIAGFRSSIPCPPVPLFTLRLLSHDSLRKTQGQDGSLLLSCKTLSFSTSCRFIPAHVASPISFPVRLFHSPLHAGLSRRSSVPYSSYSFPLFLSLSLIHLALALTHHIPTSRSTNSRTSFLLTSIG